MTTDQIARLQALPDPSAAMRRYCAAVTTFLEEDQAGGWRAPAGRINAKDEMEEAWRDLPYREKEIVRACERGE